MVVMSVREILTSFFKKRKSNIATTYLVHLRILIHSYLFQMVMIMGVKAIIRLMTKEIRESQGRGETDLSHK
jgi:hypothetical protein